MASESQRDGGNNPRSILTRWKDSKILLKGE
jgi:hypothetical protein